MAGDEQRKAVKVIVPSDETEEQKKARIAKEEVPLSRRPDNAGKPEKDDPYADMNEEDRLLKEKLDHHIEVLKDPSKKKQYVEALQAIRTEIRSSTSSMTSVPKPLKFLRDHYSDFQKFHQNSLSVDEKVLMADILSVVGMTLSLPDGESLKYRMYGTNEPIGSWGHEYVRFIAAELGAEFTRRNEKGERVDDLMDLVDEILAFDMQQNVEAEACDLLIEVDCLEKIHGLIRPDNFAKTCVYLLRMSNYLADTEEQMKMLKVVFDVYLKCGALPDALRVAIKMNSRPLILDVFAQCKDQIVLKQLGFILSSQKLVLPEYEDDDEMMEIMGNGKLHEHFLILAKELDVLEPKSPEDIYKTHLTDSNRLSRKKPGNAAVDSAKQNLASTFVNAFVNAGFGKDPLMTPEGSDWMYKNKDHGMMSATASVGLILLWDLELGFSAIDKYSYNTQEYLRAGAMLATGMVSSGVSSEMDAAFGLLSEVIDSSSKNMKLCAIMGLGLSYAGTEKEDVNEIIMPILSDSSQGLELVGHAAIALGMVNVGTANDEISGAILECFMERSSKELDDCCARFLAIGLGLLYLGKGEACEAILEAVQVVEHPINKLINVIVQTCAFAATGNVLQVQKFLSIVGEHLESEEASRYQAVAVLGIAAVALGENLGAEMALRSFDNMLQYCEVVPRRAVPLALGLLSVSYPQVAVVEILSKLSHDHDEEVSQNAILGLGLAGAGTNNSRIAQMLRQLAVYYQKEPNHLFLVRIAQGFLHLGKGLLSLSPYYSDNFLLSKVGLAGLLSLLFHCLDMKNTILAERHYLLYSIVTAIRPRMLITLDEELKPLPVSVRVGQAVDTVGQAGSPKTITGFQTHTTPVLLGYNDRAELATDEYIPVTSVLEGFVILKKNPEAGSSPMETE
ncbi:26S proteasome non-ATPase regulatory subunit 2 like protein [Plasmodiophora brassicae]|uniref:26S proteasome non-ATPase regulatory subunit 2 homolog n=1 Tax=Plasmodiophora brassicae TaxID=37360 RepID=A0A0G4IJI4_PLABS|nr:hypothetical protein PBRA_004006 [Plasmodiophora brassicae]